MKHIIILFISITIFGCTSKNSNSPEKTFEGELTLTPAESALLCFDRYAEIQKTEVAKEKIKAELKALDLYNKANTLALFIDSPKVEKAKAFIADHLDELILERHSTFIWKKQKGESLLYLKDESKSIEIGSLVLSVSGNDSTTTIQFDKKAQRVLSGFNMKYLNRPILLEINGQLITSVKAFGKLKDGQLVIPTKQ